MNVDEIKARIRLLDEMLRRLQQQPKPQPKETRH
jgi:hypothetical protein